MSSRSSRRKQTSSAVSAVLILALAGGLAFAGAPSAKPPPAATARAATTVPPPVVTAVHVRKEIHSLTATEITNYRKGVALMQSRSFSDPTSWIYQANMHGYPANNAICPVVGTPQPFCTMVSVSQPGMLVRMARPAAMVSNILLGEQV